MPLPVVPRKYPRRRCSRCREVTTLALLDTSGVCDYCRDLLRDAAVIGRLLQPLPPGYAS